MKCPLSPWHNKELIGTDQVSPWDCLQAECAWWVEKRDLCSIAALAEDIDLIERKRIEGF